MPNNLKYLSHFDTNALEKTLLVYYVVTLLYHCHCYKTMAMIYLL